MDLSLDMQRVVLEQSLGFVATATHDGRPNLSPKGTTTVFDDHRLMFADVASPGTVENLAANPHVEVNVVDPILRKGYRFKGHATAHTGGAMFDRGLAVMVTDLAHLDDADLTALPCLSVFSVVDDSATLDSTTLDSTTLDSAIAVIADPGAADSLERLVAGGLVLAHDDGSERCISLPRTVAAFMANDVTAARTRSRAAARHAAHFADLAAR